MIRGLADPSAQCRTPKIGKKENKASCWWADPYPANFSSSSLPGHLLGHRRGTATSPTKHSLQELGQGQELLCSFSGLLQQFTTGAQEGIAEFILGNPYINMSTLELLLQAVTRVMLFCRRAGGGFACQGQCCCLFPSPQQGFWSSLGVQQPRGHHWPPDSLSTGWNHSE